MTRSEFYAAFREARKVNAFMRALLPGRAVCSLTDGVPLAAWSAACRYGDALQWQAVRSADGRYRSRVR
jgi:hypothetical protein